MSGTVSIVIAAVVSVVGGAYLLSSRDYRHLLWEAIKHPTKPTAEHMHQPAPVVVRAGHHS